MVVGASTTYGIVNSRDAHRDAPQAVDTNIDRLKLPDPVGSRLAPPGPTGTTCDELAGEVQHLQSALDEAAALPAEIAKPYTADNFLSLSALLSDRSSVDDEARQRRQRLVDAGYAESEAAWLVQREAELMMQVMQPGSPNDDTADGPIDYLDARLAARRALREEIGDYQYEQYLLASGQSTSLALSRVLPGSPAASAGLRSGDKIVSYNGRRVFSIFDLREDSKNGAPGDQAIVDILRDGAAMQIVVPGGQLGVSGGRMRDVLTSL